MIKVHGKAAYVKRITYTFREGKISIFYTMLHVKFKSVACHLRGNIKGTHQNSLQLDDKNMLVKHW